MVVVSCCADSDKSGVGELAWLSVADDRRDELNRAWIAAFVTPSATWASFTEGGWTLAHGFVLSCN